MQTITIGEVLKPQGVRGEIKVKPYIDDITDYKRIKKVFIADKEYKVLACRVDYSAAYLALSGIADRDGAELLRGKEVKALRSDKPEIQEDRYYIVDIIGCKVETEKGIDLGEIIDVTSAHTDIFTLKSQNGEYMFPVAEGVIESVDIENKLIIVNEKRIRQVWVKQD